MAIENRKWFVFNIIDLRLSGLRFMNRSGLLIFVSLFSTVEYVYAQNNATKHGWSVSVNTGDEVEKVPDSTAAAGSEVEAPAQPLSLQETTKTDNENIVIDKLVTEPKISLKQSVDLNLQLKETLDLQFKAIQKLSETEDSFSEQFGELYLAYARSLLKVGRLDDARKMLANALHNNKINHGVNSLEQRPILRELFTMSLTIGNFVDAEKHLKRLIWLDTGAAEDTYSFDMIMQLGNYYLDQYLMTPAVTEESLVALNKSIRYFGYAIRRYSDASIKKLPLPYGDFAYAHYLKAKVRTEIDAELYVNARRRSYTEIDKHDTRSSTDDPFSESNRYLRLAYSKAKDDLDLGGIVKALLSIGDLHLLYVNASAANIYYQLARESAVALDSSHPIVQSFNDPVKLPAFELSVKRDPTAHGRSYQIVPMLLDVNINGSIGSVTRQSGVDLPMGMRIRAKQLAKSLRFRPVIDNGELVSVDDYHYDVQVPVRKHGSLANKEAQE